MSDAAAGRWARGLAGAALMLALAGCATGPNANPQDPLEPFNRGVTRFNDAVDKAVLKPVATTYVDFVPKPVRTGVGNFFANIGDVWSTVNNALQAKPKATVESVMRVSVNTVFGLGGLIDIASEMGIERHKEDFGQTLGRWGVPPGPYLVLPVLGPSTLRDTVALPVDTRGNLVNQVDPVRDRNQLIALKLVDTRASLLDATNLLGEVSLDPYTFTRDFYLQKRNNDVHDGAPPAAEERWDEDAPAEPAAPASPPQVP